MIPKFSHQLLGGETITITLLLGYQPEIDFVTGLKRTVDWISERWSRELQSSAT